MLKNNFLIEKDKWYHLEDGAKYRVYFRHPWNKKSKWKRYEDYTYKEFTGLIRFGKYNGEAIQFCTTKSKRDKPGESAYIKFLIFDRWFYNSDNMINCLYRIAKLP